MDPKEYQNPNILSHFVKSQFLKNLTQLLLSVSVFSFLFSYFSWLSFLHSFNFYFSAFPSQLFTHTIDKTCIFLLCNGLLVYLAKTSGFIELSSSKSNPRKEPLNNYEDSSQSEALILLDTNVPLFEKEIEVESSKPLENVDLEEGKDEDVVEAAIVGEAKQMIVEYEEEEEEEEEEEDGNVALSTEELNKKFDDFIRRMKEEIRIEAQGQLVVV